MRALFTISWILLFSFVNSACSAQIKESLCDDARCFLCTGLNMAKAPLHFRNNNFKEIGTVVGGTALLFLVDKDAKRFALSHQNATNDKVFNFDSFYGNGYTATLTAGIYGFGLFFNHPAVRHVGLQSMEAFYYSGMITGGLKLLFGRRRPYGGDSQLFFKPFQSAGLYQSLPSGHTTVSFAVSTVLAKSMDNACWKTFWYGAAGMTAASRVYHNVHWFSDVVLGGIVGYRVAGFIVNADKGRRGGKCAFVRKGVRPYVSDNGVGIV